MAGSKMDIRTAVSSGKMSKAKLTWFIVLAVAVVFVPILFQGFQTMSFFVRVLGVIGIYVLLALGLNIVVGYAGLLDLGYVAFYAMGAYGSVIVGTQFVEALAKIQDVGLRDFLTSTQFILMLPVAALLAALTGLALGTPVLRLRGDYLAIVTLGFGEIIRILATNDFLGLTHGAAGMMAPNTQPLGLAAMQNFVLAVPSIGFNFQMSVNLYWYFVVLILIVLAVFVVRRLDDSRLGRAWVAMREDEVAASSVGVNIMTSKLWAFALGALWGGLAGVVFANFQGFVSPESFTFMESVFIVTMVVLGGMGSIPGTIVGAALIAGIPEIIRGVAQSPLLSSYIDPTLASQISGYRYLVFGLLMVVMMAWRPQGMIPSVRRAQELHPEDEHILEEEDQSLWDIKHGENRSDHDL